MVSTFDSTGDDVSDGLSDQGFGAEMAWLVHGWFLPSALTATRRLFGSGSNASIRIDTSTDELRFVLDATTDPVNTTTGVDQATGAWRWIAWFGTATDTGPACAHRAWVAANSGIPAEVTVSVTTAPTGTFSAASSYSFGNQSSATSNAFEGSVQDCGVLHQWTGTPGVERGFPIAAYGVCTDAEAYVIYHRYVFPLWRGEVVPGASRDGDANLEHFHIPAELVTGRLFGYETNNNAGANISGYQALTGNTATEDLNIRRSQGRNEPIFSRHLVHHRRF